MNEFGYTNESYLTAKTPGSQSTYERNFSSELAVDSVYHANLKKVFDCIDAAHEKGYKDLSEEAANKLCG